MADTSDLTNYVLPASPNWYYSTGTDFSITGLYGFAAKKCVYLLDVNGPVPAFRGQFTEHTDRVSSVRFCPHALHPGLCASGADDKTVRLWDVETKGVLANHTTHTAKVTSISWSPQVKDLILSADEKGTVIAWYYNKNTVHSTCPIQEYIFCVESSSVSSQQAAVGYKNGLIVILQVDSQGMLPLHRLRGHESDVHSLAWCPLAHLDFGPLQNKANDAQGSLLISGSRDLTIRLWDTLSGKLITLWNLPKRSTQKWRDKQQDWHSKDRMWVSVCWPQNLGNKIITSSHGGELLLWDLSTPSPKDKVHVFGSGHSRIVFNVSCTPCGTKLMTTSMDRQVILWDVARCQQICTIATLGGYVYAMAISPLDPGTLALGVGDNMIRVWHTTSESAPYDAISLWQGIKSKVMMVCWHPQKEGLLAFGTDDGQVGIYNTIGKSKPEVFAMYHKKTVYSVSWGPSCPDEGKEGLHVYSCGGEGTVLQHRPGHTLSDAVDVNTLIKSTNDIKRKLVSRTDVSWSPDGAAMALGNDDGSIEIFVPPSLRQVCIIAVHKKAITCLAWHHGYGDNDRAWWLASGSNESTVHIHDLSKAIECASHDAPSTITASYRQLVGHCGRVTALSWSPHHPDRLVTSSYDGSAQVWDVETNQPIANYRGHVGRVMSVCWSYLDPDVVFSGGEDGTVRPWRVSLQTHTHPPVVERYTPRSGSKSKKRKQKGKDAPDNTSKAQTGEPSQAALQRDVASSASAPENNQPSENTETLTSPPPPSKPPKTTEDPMDRDWRVGPRPQQRSADAPLPHDPSKESHVTASPINLDWRIRQPLDSDAVSVGSTEDDRSSVGTRDSGPVHINSKTKAEGGKKKKKVKSMFPLSAIADNKSKGAAQQECIALARFLNKDSLSESAAVPGQSDSVNLGLFADRQSAYSMLFTEGQHHADNSNMEYQLQLEVWKGNLAGALEMASKKKGLSDWLVALSPLAGHDVWLKTAELYADHLVAQGSHQKAVLYYLACHRVDQAINVYKNQAMFREALALAKVRLCDSDPVLHELYVSWAKKLETENAYEQAAKCYLAAHLPADAVRILSTRGDHASLSTALQVAKLFCEDQLSAAIAVRLLHQHLGTGNWSSAFLALEGCQDVEGYMFALCTHELLYQELIGQEVLTVDVFSEPHPSRLSDDSQIEQEFVTSIQSSGPLASDKSPWFVRRLLGAWEQANVLTADHKRLLAAAEQLNSYRDSNLDENLTPAQLLVRVTYGIASSVVSGLLQDPVLCVRSLLQVFESCIKNNALDWVTALCDLLLPYGSESIRDVIRLGQRLARLLDISAIHSGTEVGPIMHSGTEEGPIMHSGTEEGPIMHSGTSDTPIAHRGDEMLGACKELYDYVSGFYWMVALYKLWWREPVSHVVQKKAHHVTNGQEPQTHKLSHSDVNQNPDSINDYSTLNGSSLRKTGESSTSDVGTHGHVSDNMLPDVKISDERSPDVKLSDERSPDVKVSVFDEMLAGDVGHHGPVSVMDKPCDILQVLLAAKKYLILDTMAHRLSLQKQLNEVKKAVVLLRSRRILASVAATKTTKGEQRPGVSPEEALPGGGIQGGELDNMATGADQAADQGFGLGARAATLETRYQLDSWTLETIEHEEELLQRKLDAFVYKDLPFPDPVDAAMILGYLCCHTDGLPVYEPAVLYTLGRDVAKWALEYAQWDRERKCLSRVFARCSGNLE